MTIAKPDLERFLNNARIKMPGASDNGIKLELYEALSEFFADTRAWRETLTLAIIPGTQTYKLVLQHGGQIIALVGVWDSNFIPQPAFLPEFDTLALVHPYNTPQTFSLIVAKELLLPTQRDAIPDAPDWVLRVYERTILDGVLGRMMGQMSKTYSNPQLSTYHLKRFRDGIAMARVAANRLNTQGAQAWAFPRNFRSGGQRGGVSTGYPAAF
jgi:hypothetical protein